MARVTVRTIADALGISVSTVSNAYNRPDQLSSTLRAQILSKADELGYAGPDAAARALRSGRAEAVGVVLTERLSYAFSDPYAIGFLTGLCEVVEQRHISIVLMPLSLDGDELDVTAVRHAKVDALTTFGLSQTHPAVMVAKARGIRLVLSDANSDPDSRWVAIDDVAGGRLLGRHLASLGHQNVAVVVDTTRPAGGWWLSSRTTKSCSWTMRPESGGCGRRFPDRFGWFRQGTTRPLPAVPLVAGC